MTATNVRKTLFEVTDENGYIISEKYCIPDELLSIILSYIEPESLVFNCRRVCKAWCNVIDIEVWRLKFKRSKQIVPVQELPWFACYWIYTKKLLNRNLIKNGCGEEKLKHWKVLLDGGDRWSVEKPPEVCEDFPKDADEEVLKNNSCFVTSFADCAKEQLIDLALEGATPEFMDVIRPKIFVSEWYAGRLDCLSDYRLNVILLDKDKLPAHDGVNSDASKGRFYTGFIKVGSTAGGFWKKISHVFENYDPGVRYIRFQHFGKDSQFWKGHCGSKMTGASVILSLPDNFTNLSLKSDNLSANN